MLLQLVRYLYTDGTTYRTPFDGISACQKIECDGAQGMGADAPGEDSIHQFYGERTKRFLLSDVWTALYGEGPPASKVNQEENP
jgi:hypothetical protein